MARTDELEVPVGMNMDKFDKQIAELEKKVSREEKRKLNIEADLNFKQSQLESLRNMARPIKKEMLELEKQINAIELKPSVSAEEKTAYSLMVDRYNELNHQMNSLIGKNNTLQHAIRGLTTRQEEVNSKVGEYQSKINSLTLEKHKADIDKVKSGFNDVGSSIQKTVTKVGRLALGIIGIRTALSALRRASSDLASYDTQYAANLEYIRFALTQAIAPVLRYIVSLAATVLSYINAILNALFGINIFSNASTKEFAKMKKSASGVSGALGGASKAVKEIKKQLAGFDEVNMLQADNDSGGSGGGGVGGADIPMPNFNLADLQGETPEWLKWIADHKEMVLGFLARFSNFY